MRRLTNPSTQISGEGEQYVRSDAVGEVTYGCPALGVLWILAMPLFLVRLEADDQCGLAEYGHGGTVRSVQ